MKNENAIVIGAGIGGLATACLLATEGIRTTVLEKNDTPGGKMQEYIEAGYRFDTGPSLLTMPFLLEKLFSRCGKNLNDYLEFSEPEIICRYFYSDGTLFDSYSDPDKAIKEVQNIAPADADAYRSFLNYTEDLYSKTADSFLFNPLYEFKDLKSLNWLDLLSIDAFSTVSDKVDQYFESDYLRQFFKRFTTYNGSSPFKAPATLNVIPHVELNQGGYYVQGGLYRIAESLEILAKELGVTFRYNTPVTEIMVKQKEATGVKAENGEVLNADLVFANSDATDTIVNLLPECALSKRKRNRQKKIEPSCSGFVIMLGCNKQWEQLRHHNIFFSSDYKKEFEQIFEQKVLPDDPTIYIANTSYTDKNHAPEGGSNLFILINAPYLSDDQDWELLSINYRDKIIKLLSDRGLKDLENSIKVVKTITPFDFYNRYGSNRGSIYGTSSNNKFSAFLRPRNKLREFENIYLTGGSTHPGGGIPLVLLSAFNALELMKR